MTDNTAHKFDDEETKQEHKDVHLNWKKIALVGFIPLLLIFIGFFAVVKYIGGDNYTAAIDWFDENLGMWGIFFYVYVVDTLILPLSPDSRFDESVHRSTCDRHCIRSRWRYIICNRAAAS